MNKEGKVVRVRRIEVLSSMPSFHRYIHGHALLSSFEGNVSNQLSGSELIF